MRGVHERYDRAADVEPQGRQLRKGSQRAVRGVLRGVAIVKAVPLRGLRVVGGHAERLAVEPREVAHRVLVGLVVPNRPLDAASPSSASDLPVQVSFSDRFWCHCESLEIWS